MTLLVSGWPGAPSRDTLDGMEVRRVGGRYTYGPHAVRYYRRELRRQRFDVVVEDLNKVPLFSPLWVREPVVLLVHHLFGRVAFEEAPFPVAAATWVLERPIGRVYRSVPVQAVSRSTAEDLVRRGLPADHITVIPNGVDLDYYSPEPEGRRFSEPTILYLGRLKRYKRVDLVLRAAGELVRRGVEFRLIVAGTGDDGERLRRLAAELGLGPRVEMPGFVSEERKRELFRLSWVHVLTSEKEGWGITNLEAAACATPTVASDSPGLRDSVVHGETGFLVPHGDVGALADRLEQVVCDDGLRKRLGAGARRFAAGFTWERAAADTAAHLMNVAARARG